jgi:hypothetical protein
MKVILSVVGLMLALVAPYLSIGFYPEFVRGAPAKKCRLVFKA